MDQKTAEMLERLAAKLGTTAEQLWAVLIAQARVEVLKNSLLIVAVLVVTTLVFNGWRKCRAEPRGPFDDSMFGWTAGLITASIVAFFVLGIAGSNLIDAALHPEYWALSRIFGAL